MADERGMSRSDEIALGAIFINVLALIVAVGAWIYPQISPSTTSSTPSNATDLTETISLWVSAVTLVFLGAYVNGYYLNTEMRNRERSRHAQHFIIGIIFSIAFVPISYLILVLVFKVNDMRMFIAAHPVVATFCMAFPAFVVMICKHTYQVATSREVNERRVEGFRRDIENFDIEDD